MKRFLCIIVLALCSVGVAAAPGGSEEKAQRARADEFVAAWNHHDVKAMAAMWAPNGDLINPFGRVAKGRAAVEQLLTEEQGSGMKGTTFNMDSFEVRMLNATTSIQDWDVTVTGITPPGATTPIPPLKHHVTAVLVKKDGTWWVAAARPMVPAPAPGAAHH